jgi:hypothetical protein
MATKFTGRIGIGMRWRGAGGKHNNKEVQEVKFKINSRFSGAPESRERTQEENKREERSLQVTSEEKED